MSVIKVALLTFMSLLMGTSASLGTTKYEVGPGRVMRSFVGTTQSQTVYHLVDLPVLVPANGTGSATIKTTGPDGTLGTKYASICIPSPLTKFRYGTGSGTTANMSFGSGGIVTAIYGVVADPANIGGDMGFVKNCTTNGTGSDIFNNTTSGTGARSLFFANGSTWKDWNGADYVKLGLRGNPTSSYKANLFLIVMDNPGE